MNIRLLYWLLPIGWMGVIFQSSSTPYTQQDIKPLMGEFIDFTFLEPYVAWIYFTYNGSPVSLETHGAAGLIEFFIRKGAHIFVFFLLACLFKLAIGQTTELHVKRQLLLTFLLTAAYAVMDETHQGFTPNRTAYFGDVILDSFGALLAVFLICFKIHYLDKKKEV